MNNTVFPVKVVGHGKNFNVGIALPSKKKCLWLKRNSHSQIINPVTNSPVKKDDRGNYLPGEIVLLTEHHTKDGILYCREYDVLDELKSNCNVKTDKLVEPEAGINISSLLAVQNRNVESCIRDIEYQKDDRERRAMKLSVASAEPLTSPREFQFVEFKPECFTNKQRQALYRALCAMTKEGGHVVLGIEDFLEGGHLVVRGLAASLKKHGSLDKLEASIRNEFNLHTSSMVELQFHWFKTDGGKVYADIEVAQSELPVLLDDRCYVRTGNISVELHGLQKVLYIRNYRITA